MRVDERVAVAQLAREHDLRRNAAEGFQRVFRSAAGIVGAAAGGDDDLIKLPKFLRAQIELIQNHLAVLQARGDGGAHRRGLLHDLLEHEVIISALLGGLDRPGDAADGLFNLPARAVKDRDALRRELGEVAVVEIDGVFRVAHERGHVGREVIFPDADAEDQRARLLDGIERVGLVGAEDAEGVGPFEPRDRAHDGGFEVSAIEALEQVDDDLRVRLALEGVARGDELLAQLREVFDDAVVHHGEAPVVRQMRVGVQVRGRAVRRPAGVPDAGAAGHGRAAGGLVRELLHLAADLLHLNDLIAHDGDARGVIAAVLQPPESLQQQGRGLPRAGKSNDSTHDGTLLFEHKKGQRHPLSERLCSIFVF